MQRFYELKQHLGSNIGYTSMKIAVGCGAVVAVSLITTQCYMKWKKKRKITRIIDTFEEFQNGRVHIKNPDRVEDKVLHFIKGGSSKLQLIADFDKFLLLPEAYSELINKINGIRIKAASNGFSDDCDVRKFAIK
ncbi:cytosolic 5'-nucleotidase 3A-like [Centruroides sculpturatus]|uniref:cytosolic 5'-nucleotidase 3A-like n=1 Tax=Centruroides sculpturatus TaxID=218467 RepID=UPI000C6E8EAB|nr:cytosolic 5'-nucleotidase 3A-like [Centruroides sculpturatus]